MAAINADEGTAVPRPANPAKNDYTFTGWFSAETGGAPYSWPHNLTGNITMHAQWTPASATYTITFNTYGGSPVAAINNNAGTLIPMPQNPVRAGYTFMGWYSEETGGALYPWPHNLTGNIIMHAQWWDDSQGPLIQYTITFDTHGGSYMPDISAYEGTAVNRPADPAKYGCTFTGWFSEENGGIEYNWPYTPAEDITMHAQWQEGSQGPFTQYTITFNTHGGSDVPDITDYEGTEVDRPADPEKDGYIFIGWYSEETGGALQFWPLTLMGNITIHARWWDNSQTPPAEYTITFITHGGSQVPSISAYEGTTVGKPTDPTREGYSFMGWYSMYSMGIVGGTEYNWPHTLTGNVTMHAQWQEVSVEQGQYRVTFYTNESSSEPEHQMVTAGGIAYYSGSTTKTVAEGLYQGTIDINNLNSVTLDGWYTDGACTELYDFNSPVTRTLDLYAKWPVLPVDLSGQTGNNILEKALKYIATMGYYSRNYTIVLADYALTMPPIGSVAEGNINTPDTVITLVSKVPTTISLSGKGSLFRVTAGKLILEKNITLKGLDSNDVPLVYVTGYSNSLTIKTGAKITGNNNAAAGGGGVYVGNYAGFEMSGGEISDNSAKDNGGGVYFDGGSFTMSGGEISGNSAKDNGDGVYFGDSCSFIMSGGVISGKVYVGNYSNFEMSGGETGNVSVTGGSFSLQDGKTGSISVSGNNARFEMSGGATGGVSVSGNNARFEMSGGATGGVSVSGNNAEFEMSGGAAVNVSVSSGSFTMKTGAKISGNSSRSVSVTGGVFTMNGGVISGNSSRGGVYVYNSGSFTMNGGEISGNSATNGGGVFVSGNAASFEMSGGEISGNSASPASGFASYGGGVYVVSNASFKMSGGLISGNFISIAGDGGGVYVGSGSSFEMSGGEISGNSGHSGGGVYVYNSGSFTMKAGAKISGNFTMGGDGGGVFASSGSFTMEGGEISGNKTNSSGSNGGGVCAFNFTMSGGKISGNSATNYGGGVYGSFTMSGGEISGNSADSDGGGVYASGSFTKSGQSTIYGDTDIIHTAGSTENTSGSGKGHAVHAGSGRNRYSTAGPGVNLDSSKDGLAGGWEIVEMPSGLSLEQSLTWLSNNAVGDGEYTITLHNNESIAPNSSLSYDGKIIKITLKGDTSERTISLNSPGSLFTVGGGVTLTLGSNVTLQGRSDHTSPLVSVSGGTLEMNAGSKITGNSGHSGGGVYVGYSGNFEMIGGEISGNSAAKGGGVCVDGSFTMSGGVISGNSVGNQGGGVYVSNGFGGSFTMEGGEISGNSGGGVYVSYNGNFEMSGGEISGNSDCGVTVGESGSFTMSGGEISSNSSSLGGGVYVGGSFSKTGGGIIYGSDEGSSLKNTANSGDTSGHAVFYSQSSSNRYYRDTTLNAGDNISTGTVPESATGSYDSTNWIKK